MPPKADPYATPLHRRIDAMLMILTAVIAAIIFATAAHSHAAEKPATAALHTVSR